MVAFICVTPSVALDTGCGDVFKHTERDYLKWLRDPNYSEGQSFAEVLFYNSTEFVAKVPEGVRWAGSFETSTPILGQEKQIQWLEIDRRINPDSSDTRPYLYIDKNIWSQYYSDILADLRTFAETKDIDPIGAEPLLAAKKDPLQSLQKALNRISIGDYDFTMMSMFGELEASELVKVPLWYVQVLAQAKAEIFRSENGATYRQTVQGFHWLTWVYAEVMARSTELHRSQASQSDVRWGETESDRWLLSYDEKLHPILSALNKQGVKVTVQVESIAPPFHVLIGEPLDIHVQPAAGQFPEYSSLNPLGSLSLPLLDFRNSKQIMTSWLNGDAENLRNEDLEESARSIVTRSQALFDEVFVHESTHALIRRALHTDFFIDRVQSVWPHASDQRRIVLTEIAEILQNPQSIISESTLNQSLSFFLLRLFMFAKNQGTFFRTLQKVMPTPLSKKAQRIAAQLFESSRIGVASGQGLKSDFFIRARLAQLASQLERDVPIEHFSKLREDALVGYYAFQVFDEALAQSTHIGPEEVLPFDKYLYPESMVREVTSQWIPQWRDFLSEQTPLEPFLPKANGVTSYQ